MSSEYNWTELFADPDGDNMTYDAYALDADAATVYKSATGFIIAAKKEAETTLVLVATDAQNAKTTVKKPLHITGTTGIGGINTDNSGLSANGSGITMGKSADSAEFYLYDVAGKLLVHKTAKNLRAGDTVSFGTTSLEAGVYTVIAKLDSETSGVKFAVK